MSASTPDRRPLGRFHEVELELDEAADRRAVNRLLRRLRRCSRRGDALPKIARALGEPAQAPADLVVPTKPGPKATTEELVRYVLAASVEELLDHDPLVRIGEDPEAVHRARVGTRRLRSHLRTFRPVLDRAWADGLRDELRWIGDLLGHVRDDDVLLELLQSRAKALPERHTQAFEPLRERLEAQRRRHRDALLDAMRSRRYSALLDALVDAVRGPHMSVGWTGRRATRAAAKVTRRPWARVRKQMKSLSDPPTDAELHEVRKRAKQVRYRVRGRGAGRRQARQTHLEGGCTRAERPRIAPRRGRRIRLVGGRGRWRPEPFPRFHRRSARRRDAGRAAAIASRVATCVAPGAATAPEVVSARAETGSEAMAVDDGWSRFPLRRGREDSAHLQWAPRGDNDDVIRLHAVQ